MTKSLSTLCSVLVLSCLGVSVTAAPPSTTAPTLDFKSFFDSDTSELKPSAQLLASNGKRVRLVGFMVHMESAPAGAFYIARRPVFCDEEGAGTADLPPESVRVIVRGAKNQQIGFVPRPIEVTGILQVGPQMEAEGQISRIRLILDGPPPAQTKTHVQKASSHPSRVKTKVKRSPQ